MPANFRNSRPCQRRAEIVEALGMIGLERDRALELFDRFEEAAGLEQRRAEAEARLDDVGRAGDRRLVVLDG